MKPGSKWFHAGWLLLLVLSLRFPGAATAQTPNGVLLRWDHCWGDGGAANKSFACDTNVGTDLLVASFTLGTPLSDPVGGFQSRLRITSASPTLPAWWSLNCRSWLGSLADPPDGSQTCASWANGNLVAAGVSVVQTSSNSIQLQASASSPTLVSLGAAQEYFALSIVIRHPRTVGSTSCSGCNVPACIAFENITFDQVPVPRVLLDGAQGEASRFVSWQNSVASDIQPQCDLLPGDRVVCSLAYSCAAAVPTRAQGSTWSQVKTLYR